MSDYIQNVSKDSIVSMCFIEKGVPTYGRINSNNVESENSRMALSRRSKTLLEAVFYFADNLSKLLARRKKEAEELANRAGISVLLPSISEIVRSYISLANEFTALSVGEGVYKVSLAGSASGFVDKWTVDTPNARCSCNAWQDFLYPCVHAVAVKVIERIPDREFEDRWFSQIYRVENYRRAFDEGLIVPALQDIVERGPILVRPSQTPKVKPGPQREEKRMRSNGET